MNVQTEKIELAKKLLETDDESLIQEVKAIFESHEKDFWHDLPAHVKEGIERSQQQAAQGVVSPHDEVIKKYKKYL